MWRVCLGGLGGISVLVVCQGPYSGGSQVCFLKVLMLQLVRFLNSRGIVLKRRGPLAWNEEFLMDFTLADASLGEFGIVQVRPFLAEKSHSRPQFGTNFSNIFQV